jgi:hypothetical protein
VSFSARIGLGNKIEKKRNKVTIGKGLLFTNTKQKKNKSCEGRIKKIIKNHQ